MHLRHLKIYGHSYLLHCLKVEASSEWASIPINIDVWWDAWCISFWNCISFWDLSYLTLFCIGINKMRVCVCVFLTTKWCCEEDPRRIVFLNMSSFNLKNTKEGKLQNHIQEWSNWCILECLWEAYHFFFLFFFRSGDALSHGFTC